MNYNTLGSGAHVRLPLVVAASCCHTPGIKDNSYSYSIRSSGLASQLPEHHFTIICKAFADDLRPIVASINKYICWGFVLVCGGLGLFLPGTSGPNSYGDELSTMATVGLAVIGIGFLVLIASHCANKKPINVCKDTCVQLMRDRRFSHLRFSIEPYTVGVRSGRAFSHCVQITLIANRVPTVPAVLVSSNNANQRSSRSSAKTFVTWAGSDDDIPKGSVGIVASYHSDGVHASVKFRKGQFKLKVSQMRIEHGSSEADARARVAQRHRDERNAKAKQELAANRKNSEEKRTLTAAYLTPSAPPEVQLEEASPLALWFQKHKIRTNDQVLRVLRDIGVDEPQDLKHLDAEDITNICSSLNKIGSKKFRIVLEAKENPEELFV